MRYILTLVTFCASFAVWSQTLEKQAIIEQRIEFIGEVLEDSDLDLTTFFDDLFYFYDNPININSALEEDLMRLHLLTDIQILSILNYRYRYGAFLTLFELAAIPELGAKTIEMILPFIKAEPIVKDDFVWKNAFRYGKHDFILRYQNTFEEKAGYAPISDSILALYPNRQYLGSSDKLYFRYRTTYKDRISWGITAEKDAGEEFFRGSQKQGFDFYSGHLFLRKVWKFNSVALGDYQVNLGQGLTMWNGFGIGKSADVMNGKRSATGLRPYTSVNEALFLRGAAFNLKNERFDFTGFASAKKMDASVNSLDSLDLFDDEFGSFQLSGFHRTPSEIADKNKVLQTIFGGEFAVKGENYRVGLTSVYTHYDTPFVIDTSDYKKYKFSGNSLLTTGLNYRLFYRNMTFFGETAAGDNLKFGTVNGFSWNVDPRVDLLAIYRNYDKAFHSNYSTGFGESSDNTGERGIYIGMQANLTTKWSLDAYYDQFKFTYLKWLTADISHGREYFAQINYQASRRAKFYLRFRNKITQRNEKEAVFGIKGQDYLLKNTIRLNYDQKISDQWSFKTRVEYVNFTYGEVKNHGFLFFQDLRFDFKKLPLTIYGRYAIFDTENYDTRIYAYENDLLGVFSIPSYYYQGIRTYLMVKYDISEKMECWLRWDVFSYANEGTISSGLEEIQGNEKTTIKMQLKIKL
jgi:hypothetical protein